MLFNCLGTSRLYCFLLAFFLLSYSLSDAQVRQAGVLKGPVPGWVKPFNYEDGSRPDKKDIDGGEYLLLYEEQYNLEQEAVYHKIVRQITSEAGVQNSSQISITFSPAYQRLSFHSISVWRDGQVINQLDLSRIKLIRNETDLQRFIYSGLYTAYLNLEDVRPGDKVVFDYTVTGMNPVLDHQFGDILYFNAQTPISHLFIRLITAPHQHLYIKYFNEAPKPMQSAWDGKTVYEWKMDNRPPYVTEDNEPDWYYGAPYIQVTTEANWSDVASWAVKDIENAKRNNSTLIRNLVSKWNKIAGDSDLYFVKLATRFVQDQIRYMGVEMGAYSHLPHDPEQVLKQRYGDCKDKSLLLCTFLQYRHIPAFVAFVNAYYGQHLAKYLPSVNLFDHAIVTFNHKGNVYWIDPTIAYQRGSINNIATPDYGYALVVHPGEDSLTKMSVDDPGNTEVLERITLPDEAKGKGKLAVFTTYTGAAADNIRQQFHMNSLAVIQKSYRDYYNKLYNHISIDDSIQFQDDPESDRFTTTEKYIIGDAWEIVDSLRKIKRFTVYAKSLQNRLPVATSDDRKTPLSLMAPVNFTYRIQLIPPGDWSIERDDEIITRKPYYYSFASSKSGDTINLDYIYQTYRDYISPDSINRFNTDIQTISADLSYTLTQNGAIMQSKTKMSWLSVLITLFALALFSWLAIRWYRYSPDRLKSNLTEGRPIGGWLILVCIGLCITPVRLIFNMITTGYYSQSIWLNAQAHHQPGLLFLIAMELTTNIFLVVFSVLILFLFFRRRSTLPAAFIFICIFNIVFLLLDHFVLQIFISTNISAISAEGIRILIYSCVWIPYFLKSERVKQTFVYSYQHKESVPALLDSYQVSPEGENLENHEDE